MIISRKRYEEEIEKAKQEATVEQWKAQRIDELANDICELQEKVKELQYRADSAKDGFGAVWRQIDEIKHQMSRMPAD